MANFEFQRFWVEKVDFFPHGAPILPSSNPNFKINWNLSFWVNPKKSNAYFKYERGKMGAP